MEIQVGAAMAFLFLPSPGQGRDKKTGRQAALPPPRPGLRCFRRVQDKTPYRHRLRPRPNAPRTGRTSRGKQPQAPTRQELVRVHGGKEKRPVGGGLSRSLVVSASTATRQKNTSQHTTHTSFFWCQGSGMSQDAILRGSSPHWGEARMRRGRDWLRNWATSTSG
jgi:hypothetical protein